MKKYERIGIACLIASVASLALGLFVAPWCLALGAALAGASAAMEVVADSIHSRKVKEMNAGKAKEEQWYWEQQYDFMLK